MRAESVSEPTTRATQMTLESLDVVPTFEKVARLIAAEENDVEWLADGLRGWIWPQEKYPTSARKYGHGLGMFADIARVRWSRAKVLKGLKETLPRAADTLIDLMSDWGLFGFLTDERLGPPGSAPKSGSPLETYFMRSAGAVTKQVGFRSLSPRMVSQRQEETSSWRSGRSMRRWFARAP
jgi:hypothetical protein